MQNTALTAIIAMSSDPPDLSAFRQHIEQHQQTLKTDASSASSGTDAVELDQSKVGRLSRMDAMQMQQMNLASERRRQQEQIRLQAALGRIDDGSYGECFECGEWINANRLMIDLAATHCISCAETQEKS